MSNGPGQTDHEQTQKQPPKWGDPISPERQGELQGYLDRWEAETDHGERKGPFEREPLGMKIGVKLTGADVSWLVEHAGRDQLTRSVPNLHLEGADLREAYLKGADLSGAYLQRANLSPVHLEGANLSMAHLEGADLREAHLEGKAFAADDPDLLRIRQWKDDFPAVLLPADLQGAFFDDATQLREITVYNEKEKAKQKAGAVTVADLHWRGANLAVVRLPPAPLLGDERTARTLNYAKGKPKGREQRIEEFQAAVRANRQLAVALKAQGLDEDAGRFSYNAQLLQQQVLRRQRKFGAYLFSRFLDGLAGYGYKPVRSLIAYLVLVAAFAIAYYFLGQTTGPHLQWYEALVVSLTAFHGRGFFSQQFSPGAPQSVLAAGEAVVGLLIEISFIATFTQRFFGAS